VRLTQAFDGMIDGMASVDYEDRAGLLALLARGRKPSGGGAYETTVLGVTCLRVYSYTKSYNVEPPEVARRRASLEGLAFPILDARATRCAGGGIPILRYLETHAGDDGLTWDEMVEDIRAMADPSEIEGWLRARGHSRDTVTFLLGGGISIPEALLLKDV